MSQPARPTDAFDRLSEAVGERVNPIIVKEVRQSLRTRVFWVFFPLMLISCVFISLGFYAAGAEGSESTGQFAFLSFFVCLAAVQFFVIPYTAFRSMARETEEETWVLLTLTGLGPRKILSGKLGSSLLQGGLYLSAAAPFLLFSYYLNGIDLPTIVVAVLASIAYQVFLISVCVSLATLAEARIVRSMVHFLVLGLLLAGLSTGIGLSAGLAEAARSLFASGSFWLVSCAVVFGLLSTGIILFETAAARLSLATEEYARGPRLAFVAQFTGGVGLFFWGWRASGELKVLVAGAIVSSAYALLVGTLVMSDRDSMAKVHWADGGRFALLKPGAFRGYLLVLACLGLASVLFELLAVRAGGGLGDELLIAAAPGFVLVYLGASNLIARAIPHPGYQTPAMVRLVFLGLFVLGTGLPPLIGAILKDSDDVVLNALNPTIGLVNIEKNGLDAVPMVLFVWGVALALGLLALLGLRRRDVEPLT